jgi:hypothetical protein
MTLWPRTRRKVASLEDPSSSVSADDWPIAMISCPRGGGCRAAGGTVGDGHALLLVVALAAAAFGRLNRSGVQRDAWAGGLFTIFRSGVVEADDLAAAELDRHALVRRFLVVARLLRGQHVRAGALAETVVVTAAEANLGDVRGAFRFRFAVPSVVLRRAVTAADLCSDLSLAGILRRRSFLASAGVHAHLRERRVRPAGRAVLAVLALGVRVKESHADHAARDRAGLMAVTAYRRRPSLLAPGLRVGAADLLAEHSHCRRIRSGAFAPGFRARVPDGDDLLAAEVNAYARPLGLRLGRSIVLRGCDAAGASEELGRFADVTDLPLGGARDQQCGNDGSEQDHPAPRSPLHVFVSFHSATPSLDRAFSCRREGVPAPRVRRVTPA